MNQILNDKIVKYLFYASLLALFFFLSAQALLTIRQYKFVGAGVSATNTISVRGEAKVKVPADNVSFTVTVKEEAPEQELAQKEAAIKMNKILDFLKSQGIDEKDIKTQNYSLNPRYSWNDGKRKLVSYELVQSVSVKLKDKDKASGILARLPKLGASSVSSLRFNIDEKEREMLQAKARRKAIEDAKNKAKRLASDLGVDLIRIVGYSENSNSYKPPIYFARSMKLEAVADSGEVVEPDLPSGENEIVSTVSISYEIR